MDSAIEVGSPPKPICGLTGKSLNCPCIGNAFGEEGFEALGIADQVCYAIFKLGDVTARCLRDTTSVDVTTPPSEIPKKIAERPEV